MCLLPLKINYIPFASYFKFKIYKSSKTEIRQELFAINGSKFGFVVVKASKDRSLS